MINTAPQMQTNNYLSMKGIACGIVFFMKQALLFITVSHKLVHRIVSTVLKNATPPQPTNVFSSPVNFPIDPSR